MKMRPKLRPNLRLRLFLVLAVIVAVTTCVAIVIAILATARVAELTAQQKQGRHLALGVTCAAVSAISEAGHATIASAMPLPPGVEALLTAHGFPPFAVRKAQAQIAADDYVKRISATIENQVGRKGDHLVKPDGTIDCERLQVVAKAR